MEHRVCLCILIVVCTMAFMAVMLICRRRRTARQTVGKETYFVSYSPVYVGLVAGGLLFWLCLTIAVILLEEVDLVTTIILSLFIIFNLLGEFCILFWEIEIHEDKGELVYYHPPFHSIHIWISDITRIQFLENRLNSLEHYRIRIYRKGYKPFDITDDMHNFYRLAEYLRGKENDDVYGTRGYRAYEVEQRRTILQLLRYWYGDSGFDGNDAVSSSKATQNFCAQPHYICAKQYRKNKGLSYKGDILHYRKGELYYVVCRRKADREGT